MTRIYTVFDNDLPEKLNIVKNVFLPKRNNSSLHKFYTSKGIKCFCADCVEERKQQKML